MAQSSSSFPLSAPNSLLGLPGELRNLIHEEVFRCEESSQLYPGNLSYTLSCRQIYHETSALAFASTSFLMPERTVNNRRTQDRAWERLACVRPERIQAIRSLTIPSQLGYFSGVRIFYPRSIFGYFVKPTESSPSSANPFPKALQISEIVLVPSNGLRDRVTTGSQSDARCFARLVLLRYGLKEVLRYMPHLKNIRIVYHQWLSHWDIRAILYYVRRAMDYTIRQNGTSTVILPAGWTLLASGSTIDQINQTLKLTCRNTEGRTQSITVTFLPSISSGQPPSNRPTKIPDLLN